MFCYWIPSKTKLGKLIMYKDNQDDKVGYLLRTKITVVKPRVLRKATKEEVFDYLGLSPEEVIQDV